MLVTVVIVLEKVVMASSPRYVARFKATPMSYEAIPTLDKAQSQRLQARSHYIFILLLRDNCSHTDMMALAHTAPELATAGTPIPDVVESPHR